jgi:hypothetical protein
MGDDGAKLAVSAVSFASREDAHRAATDLRDSTVSAAGIEG